MGNAARAFAAAGARPAPMQACPRASRDRTRRSLRERGHDRPPRRRFPRAPAPRRTGARAKARASFPRYSSRRARPAAAVGGAPSWHWRERTARWPAARLAPGTRPHGGAFRGCEADPHVAARDHQDPAGQSTQCQPAVAGETSALHRARWRRPRWRTWAGLRAADRRSRPRCLQGAGRRRPAPFPLHCLTGGRRRAGRPAHLHPSSGEPDGSRPGNTAGLGGGRSLEHRQPAHPPDRARARRHRQRPHHRRRLHRPRLHRAAELATEWLGPRTELEIQQTLQREVERSGGQASTAHCSARPARMAGCRSNASTNPGCNASACC